MRNATILNIHLGFFVCLFVPDTYDTIYYVFPESTIELLLLLLFFALTMDLLSLWYSAFNLHIIKKSMHYQVPKESKEGLNKLYISQGVQPSLFNLTIFSGLY